jgi:hypothetical protein
VEEKAKTQGKSAATWIRSRALAGTSLERVFMAELLAAQNLVVELIKEFMLHAYGDDREMAVARGNEMFKRARAAAGVEAANRALERVSSKSDGGVRNAIHHES